jgi:hypothetical protein
MTAQDPDAPRTDELARNAAFNALLEILDERSAHTVADEHTVTWERDVNANGQPVRRYVLRGAWEVDPEPSVARREMIVYHVTLTEERPNRYRPNCTCGWESSRAQPICRVGETQDSHVRRHLRRGEKAEASRD